MNSVDVAADHMVAGVHERASTSRGDPSKLRAEQTGLFETTFELVGELSKPSDRGWADEKDIRSVAVHSEGAALNDVNELAGARRDVRRGRVESSLQVVRPEHDDDEIEGMVRLEGRREEGTAVPIWLLLIVASRRSSIQSFLDDPEPPAEFLLENPRPALSARKANRNLGVLERHASPGVRVPVTQDLTDHRSYSP